ncbi:MAG: TraR/DksA C4-type zinc finger protein [Puniceicoccales bacterium]|jgi:RNA polymerase-binding transcription factor DksA|nr:TraR/DksA C4-type zinc finger protein [Puniceicoccales bacterium]
MVQSPLARLKAEREAAAKAKAAAEEFKRAMKAAQEAAIQAKAEKSKAALAKVEGKGKGKALTETPAKPEKSVAKATLVKSTKVAEGGAGSKKAAVKATATPSTEEPASELAPERPLTTRMRTGVYFSYEDAIEYLAKHKDVKPNAYVPGDERTKSTKGKPTAKSTIPAAALKTKSRDIAAASIEDLLGFNPFNEEGAKHDESQIPAKCLKYYRILVKMRNRLQQGLSLHTEDALKKSDKEGAGDLTGYGQHMADAGTEAFDRDFALNLVSTEQEALYEIAEAIERMKRGTYGVCEQTGKQIPASRLLAVPHTRFTFEGQREREYHRRVARRNNVSNPLEEFAADGTSYSASGTTPSTDNAEEG